MLKIVIKKFQIYLRSWKKIIYLHYDTSNDSIMVIWLAFNLQHRISAIRSNVDDIKNNICDIPYFVSFLSRKTLNQFKFDQNTHSHKFYRLINEIPTILLILIVFVVIFKPL